ncbi:hypothetical protein L195_g045501 [Trifolium pratense]|uniref:Uncharacterized protein n=1 Tax=Trifolium pratense TaxID=57577 RepID=A0A2K3MF10_TRIPR|nr:hypothetical protein L195_g045501 [Trifolium pratense]
MADRKVRCETQSNDDVSSDAMVAVQMLMQLNNINNNNNNNVWRGREKRIPRKEKEVDQRLDNNKITEIDEPKKMKYRSIADIYAVTQPINPKN